VKKKKKFCKQKKIQKTKNISVKKNKKKKRGSNILQFQKLFFNINPNVGEKIN